MALKITAVTADQQHAPATNFCYFASNVGTFWLQGQKNSGEESSRATFIWNHGVSDVDMHSETLLFKGILNTTEGQDFWWYSMQTRNEDGTTTPVDVLFEQASVGSQAKIFYRRNGKGTNVSPQDLPQTDLTKDLQAGAFILWSWQAIIFEGHEDE
jgi:hypothetical protein